MFDKLQKSNPTEDDNLTRLTQTHADSAEDDRGLKLEWSNTISRILVFSFMFCISFCVLLGNKTISFESYPYFPETVVLGFFAEIVGLSWLILSHLFNQHK